MSTVYAECSVMNQHVATTTLGLLDQNTTIGPLMWFIVE